MQIAFFLATCSHQSDHSFALRPLFQRVSKRKAYLKLVGSFVILLYLEWTSSNKSGLITARLKSGGTTDVVRDAFMIVVISGTSSD